jgi:hypothetical protein
MWMASGVGLGWCFLKLGSGSHETRLLRQSCSTDSASSIFVWDPDTPRLAAYRTFALTLHQRPATDAAGTNKASRVIGRVIAPPTDKMAFAGAQSAPTPPYHFEQGPPQPAPQLHSAQQKPTQSRKSRSFSFRSDKSHGSGNRKIDLHETHAEKEAKRLHSKADPTLAMQEAEPCA